MDTRTIAARGFIGPARHQLTSEKADFGNSTEWRASDAFVIEK
jgi:hypothetical protein